MPISEYLRRLKFWIRRDRLADELDEEMRLHLELRAQANRARGMAADDASRSARRRFGNPLVLREEGRDAWGIQPVERLLHDLRFAVRRLLKQRAVTLVAVVTLGVGIGANTAMFTLLDATLFRTGQGVDASRLVWLAAKNNQSGRYQRLSTPDYLLYRDRLDLFEGVSAFSGIRVALGGSTPELAAGIIVSGNYFDMLGVRAQLGRTFTRDEDAVPGAHPVAVIGDELWRRRYGADADIINRTILVNRHPFTVIGVAPAGFAGIEFGDEHRPGIWIPLAMAAEVMPGQGALLTDPADNWLEVVGRLKPGVSRTQAASVVGALAAHAPSQRVSDPVQRTVGVLPVQSGLDPSSRAEVLPVLLLLSVVPVLVLIVAAANVGNLLLASGLSRRKELSLRRALGATRARLVRQLLAESVLLSLAGAVVAIGVSVGVIAVVGIVASVPPLILEALRPDLRVFLATTVVALSSVLIFGLSPALSVTSESLLPNLKDDGTGVALGGRRRRLRGVFVVAQVAVSVVLLITAGLFLQSLAKAVRVDPGFDAHNVVTFSYDLGLQGYSPQRREAFHHELLERVRALPGIESAALASTLPLGGVMWGNGVMTEQSPKDTFVRTNLSHVSPRYFEALRTPVVRGREFTDADVLTAPNVAVVNESLARRLWPDANPIGQRLRLSGGDQPWREIVGIARDGKYDELTEDARSFLYLPASQAPVAAMSLIARTRGDAATMTPLLVQTAHTLDADLPLYRVSTLEQNVSLAVDTQRASSSLLGVFGLMALLLAALGIYGVTAHAVTLRTKEIGIRMSLGARTSQVLRMVVGEGLRLTAIGVVIGLAMSAAASQLLATFLFGLRATDGATFVAGGVILGLVAIVASYVPARRATRVDPLRALRHE